jgi:nicotinamidase-related amidase
LLAALLRDLNVRRVFIAGLATDYCVHATVLDARKQNFIVVVLDDATRGVNRQPDDVTAFVPWEVVARRTFLQSCRNLRKRHL